MDTRLRRQFDMTARPEVETTTVPQREAPVVEETQQAPLAVTSGVGGGPDPLAHAAALVRASGGRLDRADAALLQLQRALLGRGSSKGVAYHEWTEDAQKAFKEFEHGGSSGQAKADDAWKRIFPGLERYHDPQAGTDERAKELVSHLMELVYAWRDDTRFRKVFPDCAALLDRVIIKGAPAPRT